MRIILVALLIIGTSANAFAQSAKKPVTPPSSSDSTVTGTDTSTSTKAKSGNASPTINTVEKKNLPEVMKQK